MSLDLKRQLVAQLVESSRLLRNYIDHRAKGRGTTRAQWIVLFRLRQQEGLSQVDLAEVLELQPISLVRLLDRLVEHGLLERRHDPRDRRANRLFLTASGRQLVDDLDSLRDSIASDVLQEIPDSAIETSLRTLQDIKDRIKGQAEFPAPSRPSRRAGLHSRTSAPRLGRRAHLPKLNVSNLDHAATRCHRGARRSYHGARGRGAGSQCARVRGVA